MKLKYFLAVVLLLSLTGCGLLKKYKDTQTAPENLFGTDEIVAFSTRDSSSIADLSWYEYFDDPVLRNLIDSAIVRNVDMKIACSNLRQAEIYLRSTKLAFIPALSFTPSITYNGNTEYRLPFQLDWNTPGFGSLINSKREAGALAVQAEDNRQMVQSKLVGSIALAYTQLQLLDKQLQIMNETELVWTDVYETQKALMENGKAYSTSVNQMAANLYSIKIQRVDIQESIKDVEYSISLLLAQTPQKVERNKWGSYSLIRDFGVGIPAAVLNNRPDVRVAARAVEAAYYVNKQALAAMFPSITLSGLIGWSNGGVAISDPLTLIYKAVGSLTQPLFARGQLKAQYDITKLQQQQAADLYAQTILQAGNEVNEALRKCQTAVEKNLLYAMQVEKLQETWMGTVELMKNGKATYVEVLMAQDALLKAELAQAENVYSGKESYINLYIALGGGRI